MNRQRRCGACPPAHYASSSGAVQCMVCAAGKEPTHAKTACQPCAETGNGTVSDGSQCSPCTAAGEVANGQHTSCVACAASGW